VVPVVRSTSSSNPPRPIEEPGALNAAALFTRMSILPPYVPASASAAALHCSRSVMSAARASALPPADAISSATGAHLCSTSVSTPTLAPSAANRRAIDLPMLLDPPPCDQGYLALQALSLSACSTKDLCRAIRISWAAFASSR